MSRQSNQIQLRAYNVRFGDCVLLSFDAGGGQKNVVIDFGNAPSGVGNQGGRNDVFAPIAKDIYQRTGGRIDVLIVSHEHLDHMEGFHSERSIFDKCQVGEVWMSIMSAPDYYTRYPDCKAEGRARTALLALARSWEQTGRFARLPQSVQAMVANNVLSLANRDRIDYLRKLVPRSRVRYLSRGSRVDVAALLGPRARVEVLAPEKDASVYYGQHGSAFWSGLQARCGVAVHGARASTTASIDPRELSQLAEDEFEELQDAVAAIDVADLMAIDKAANNTSLVVRFTVNGKVLLFPGDAEAESWSMMAGKRLVGPVDFLKVAHHGSINGMPFEGAGAVLAALAKPRRGTVALVSTCRGVYGKTSETAIPHHRLMESLKGACGAVHVSEDRALPGAGFDILV